MSLPNVGDVIGHVGFSGPLPIHIGRLDATGILDLTARLRTSGVIIVSARDIQPTYSDMLDRIMRDADRFTSVCRAMTAHELPCEWVKWSHMSRAEIQAKHDRRPELRVRRPANLFNVRLAIRLLFWPRTT